LPGVASDERVLYNEIEVVLKGTLPAEGLEALEFPLLTDEVDQRAGGCRGVIERLVKLRHGFFSIGMDADELDADELDADELEDWRARPGGVGASSSSTSSLVRLRPLFQGKAVPCQRWVWGRRGFYRAQSCAAPRSTAL
jgi:hypothetical protein